MNRAYNILFGIFALFCAAHAQTVGPFTLCSTAPDAQMTVEKNQQGNYYDSRTSLTTAYNQPCKPAYTVDIFVPGTFELPPFDSSILLSGGFAPNAPELTKSNCDDAFESVLIHKRTGSLGGWGPWQLISAQKSKEGTWVQSIDLGYPSWCALTVPFSVSRPSKVYLTDQYRVMVSPKLFGQPVPAMVSWRTY